MKIVIVGTNHGGIAAANTILDNYGEGNEVVMIDQNSNMSYLGCGTALWVGRQIDGYDGLFYTNPEDFKAKGAKISLETRVESIDFDNKKLSVVDKDENQYEESYDKLILATGSKPIQPNVPGADLDGISNLKFFQESLLVDEALDDVDTVAVVGAGYIGVEFAEAAQRRGKNVILFDAASNSLSSYYDPEFSKLMDDNLSSHGIQTHYNELVKEYIGDENGHVKGLITDKGEYECDLVVNCIGFKANTDLGRDHLETSTLGGAYDVDRHFRTSDPDVYAIGDCATNYSNATQSKVYSALASNAVRSGIVAAHNLMGTDLEGIGIQGSNGINIYDLKMVSTGLSVKEAEKAGLKVSYTDYEDTQLPGFMPEDENHTVKIRIVYETDSRRIVGAQMASEYDMSMGIHMFSLAIQEEVTIDKLSLLDIFFLPHFNQPYNYITMAAISAE